MKPTKILAFLVAILAFFALKYLLITPLVKPKAVEPPSEILPNEQEIIIDDIPSGFVNQSEKDIVSIINLHRQENNLGELELKTELTKAAQIRCKELFEHDYFEHVRPNGEFWSSVLTDDLDFSFTSAGENIAVMYTDISDYKEPFSAEQWYILWENSPTHFENMMSTDFKYIGCGVYEGTRDGQYYSYAATIFCNI